MREIKFRAWEKESMRWANWDEIGITSSKQVGPTTFRPDWNDTRKEFSFQLFTGLLDKNGEEIYEGDILQYSAIVLSNKKEVRRDTFAQVVWSGMGFFLKAFSEHWFSPQLTEMWVIGNIHETPELLSSKENHYTIKGT